MANSTVYCTESSQMHTPLWTSARCHFQGYAIVLACLDLLIVMVSCSASLYLKLWVVFHELTGRAISTSWIPVPKERTSLANLTFKRSHHFVFIFRSRGVDLPQELLGLFSTHTSSPLWLSQAASLRAIRIIPWFETFLWKWLVS